MNISSHIFESYLHCPTKCWLMSYGEVGDKNVYAEWMREKNQFYLTNGIKNLSDIFQPAEFIASPPEKLNLKTNSWSLASGVMASSKNMISCIHAIERVLPSGRGTSVQYIPIRFISNNKLTRLDKLLVAFDAEIFAETFKCDITYSKIIHGDRFSTSKVKTSFKNKNPDTEYNLDTIGKNI